MYTNLVTFNLGIKPLTVKKMLQNLPLTTERRQTWLVDNYCCKYSDRKVGMQVLLVFILL